MARTERSASLHHATFRVAAISFWGLGAIVMASNYLGSGAVVNYRVEWGITALAFVGGAMCWLLPWERLPAGRLVPVVFGGLAMLAVSLAATGGAQSHLLPLFMVVVVFTASLFEFWTAALALIVALTVVSVPLMIAWDGRYARFLVILAASMVICTYVPALVRKALRQENQLAAARELELEQSYLTTIEALAAALDAKDRHTEAHSRETAALARAVGQRLGLKDDTLRFLEFGALLHDIGKIGIPGYILNKPGPLDVEEVAIMREHPVIGERIVASVPFLARVRPIVRAEHERWDGGGYPDGLKADDIPIEARIIHACDAFQAMASDRAYRSALPPDRILEELRTNSGGQFDPRVVVALLDVIQSGQVAIKGTDTEAEHQDKPLPPAHAWTRHLDAIQQLGARLACVVGVQEICQTIGQLITTLLPYDQCRLYLLEDDGLTLTPVYFSDTQQTAYRDVTAEGLALQLGQGITGWVAETKHGVVVGDTEHHPRAAHIPGTEESDESMLAVPVIFEDKLIGVIVNVKIGLHQYNGDHLRLLTILANQAAVSIVNARLIERLALSATTDPLTGLANRRAFEQRLDDRLAVQSAEPFSVIMLDVDGLKQVNDAHGHAAGDAVLKEVAAVLRSHVRQEDLVTRWGGDEFVLLLPGLDHLGAISLARRIGGTLRSADGSAAIPVSMGSASFPADGLTAGLLLAAADHSMYVDKRQRAA
ncbi:MAG TPA: HD domain-containing phosphohydrolase [Candidatus Dormibacteraeota bacterium]|jgi:diguanylate cyclase (GGDEF)-like protein/putative nucleotidyltransferase with HDIG domain